MRIQHNIMAMNAYRNYTNNVSAMKSNLEKLSSGYKINRAGDDAAGLAISEKMRAQITGLQTAQKNAKDGISLVQTAEGALTEVHDMLNRMVELATQSANGTYDNDTDRFQLQKEVDQLKSEINRIADSSNFNGIKLLDGSMDSSPIAGELKNILAAAAGAADPALPEIGDILGTDTVLHKGASGSSSAEFGVSLHNVTFSNDDATGKITIKFGDDEITLTGGATKATMDTGDILSDLDETIGGTNVREMSVGTQKYVVEGDTLEEQLTSWVDQFNKDATANSNGQIIAEMKGGSILFSSSDPDQGDTVGNGLSVGGIALTGGVDGAKAVNKGTFTLGAAFANGNTFTLDGTEYKVYTNQAAADADTAFTGTKLRLDDAAFGSTAADQAKWLGKKLAETGIFEDAAYGSPVAGADDHEFTMTALENGKVAASDVAAMKTAFDAAIADKLTIGTGGPTLTFAYAADAADANGGTGVDGVAATLNSGAMTRLDPTIEIAGYKVSVTKTDAKEQLEEFMSKYNSDKTNKFTAEWNDNGNGIKFTAKEAGDIGVAAGDVSTTDKTDTSKPKFKAVAVAGADSVLGTNKAMNAKDIINAIMNGKAQLNGDDLTPTMLQNGVKLSDDATYKLTAKGDTLTFTQLETDTDPATNEINPTVLDRQVEITGTLNNTTKKNTVSGDYQKSTTFNRPNSADSGDRLASTWFINTSDNIVDGGSIFIGGKNYQFTTDEAAAKEDATKVYIGDLLNDEGKIDDASMEKVNERITVAAKDNEVYTVGFDKNRLTFTEKVGYTTGKQEYDLTKLSEIERSLGFTGPDTPSEGKALTLQIGDTADSFNQLKVNIKDMHVASLGLEDMSVATQEDAAKAVDAIKKAINTVSDVRGTLGATQNRLDHTINNLSVMTENIQDAESTIRDTDVAEEMMAYTKNNILIQSAQAMLAQANQVPQGVLQLLG